MKKRIKLLDTLHSIYIRLKYVNENAHGTCYTCGEPLHYQFLELGHYPYIPRDNTQFRWDKRITRPQCTYCNCFKDGQPEKFRTRLVQEIGNDLLSSLEFMSKKPFKYTTTEINDLIKLRRKQIRELLKEKNFTINVP